jgi:hypothetical protein
LVAAVVAANPRDHALVVGISRYVGLRDETGKTSVLEGPVVDAKSFFAWLVDPAGGGLDQSNIELIHSGQFPATSDASGAGPAYQAVRTALLRIVARTAQAQGRRLYVYMSGHGFAPDVDRGSLFTAECEDPSYPNVYASGWLNWFRAQKRFQEYVLLMDCCFDSMDSIPVEAPPVRATPLVGLAGPRFIGLAAQTGMRALECPITQDRNQVHGVFTWTLLSGLQGAAANKDGVVTGESLRAYLLNTMKDFIPPERLASREISSTPNVVSDPGLAFGARKVPPKFNVRLDVPTPDGSRVSVWSESPPREILSTTVFGGTANVPLDPGIYVAEAAGQGLRAGFDVTAEAKRVELREQSPPFDPANANKVFMFNVRAINSIVAQGAALGATLTLVDSRFNPIANSLGLLGGAYQCGIYKIIVQFGSEIANKTEIVILLDRNIQDLKILAPVMPSAVPVVDATPTHEYQLDAAATLRLPTTEPSTAPESNLESFDIAPRGGVAGAEDVRGARVGIGSAIGVLARFWTGQPPRIDDASLFPNPFEGLYILDKQGQVVADLPTVAYDRRPDPVASFATRLGPGTYLLRQVFTNGTTLDRPVIASPGWQTNVFIRRESRDVGAKSDANSANTVPFLRSMGSVSLLMVRLGGAALDPYQVAQTEGKIEGWRLALRDRRKISSADAHNLLTEKFENPIAGIIGAHLALLGEQAFPNAASPNREWLNEVILNLRGLVGPDHPDVEALSLLCPQMALRAQVIPEPPMYLRSWEVIADREQVPTLVFPPPDAWWQERHRAFNPLYMVWISGRRAASAQESTRQIVPTLEAIPDEIP